MKKTLIILCMATLLSSCTMTYYAGRVNQSHFTFPNANVVPLNQVTGEATQIKLLKPPTVSSALVNQAYYNAISKSSGADGIINADVYIKNTSILIFKQMTYVITGTAVKQDVGKQELK